MVQATLISSTVRSCVGYIRWDTGPLEETEVEVEIEVEVADVPD